MKKIGVFILILMIGCIFCIPQAALAKDKTLTFQWEQDVMVTGDKWEMHVSGTPGGPYSHLADIPYVEDKTTYEGKIENIDIPSGGYYFVLKKVRGSDGDSSGWSNEVFFEFANTPFNFKLIIGGS
jgi:hypothetical protein